MSTIRQYLDSLGNVVNYRSLDSGFLVAVGVILGILASFITCLGLNLQKLSLCAPENENVSPWRQPRWIAGFVCVLVGSIIDFVAFGLAPQSLLAPLAALSLVWNLFMASALLNERYQRADVVACILIFFGTGLTVVFASHEEKEFTLEQLKYLYGFNRMKIYGIAVPALLALHFMMIREAHNVNFIPPQYSKTCEMMGYAGFAGIAGGQSVLFAKSTVELIKDATQGDDVFLHLETYIIITMMTISLLTQITFLNGGLKNFDSLYVVPVYQSYWIMSGVIGGLVYFGEWEDLSTTQVLWFTLGTVITLVGLLVLTSKEHHHMELSAAAGQINSRRGSTGSYTPVKQSENESREQYGVSDDEQDFDVEMSTSDRRDEDAMSFTI